MLVRLVFEPDRWNVDQKVTVAGVVDDVDDGNVPYSIVAAATSEDPSYSGTFYVTAFVNQHED